MPRFEFETGYAKSASQALRTDHTIVDVWPKDYPGLLTRTIETLGYPASEGQPCKLAIAELLSASNSDLHFSFVGTGADDLHGTALARKMMVLEAARKIPLADLALKVVAAAARPFAPSKARGLRQIAGMLSEWADPYSYKAPANIAAVYTDIDMAHRSVTTRRSDRHSDVRHL